MNRVNCFVVTLGAALLLGVANEGRNCPPGQVWGGIKCEYLNICPDGTPLRGESCGGSQGPYIPPPPPKTPTPPPPPTGCQSTVVFSGGAKTSSSRTVLLSDGEAIPLFDRYLAKASDNSVGIDLERLTVVFFDKTKGRVSVEGRKKTMAEMLRGDNQKQIWRRRLKGNFAQAIKDAKAHARSLRADLVCG